MRRLRLPNLSSFSNKPIIAVGLNVSFVEGHDYVWIECSPWFMLRATPNLT